MCILDLSKVLMYELRYDYIKDVMKMSMKILVAIKKCLILVIIRLNQKTMIIQTKKPKGMNKNVVATISHNAYKDVLLNNRCIRHSMNRISKEQRIRTYKIKKKLIVMLL